MKRERYTEEQTIGIPKAYEAGAEVGDPVRERGLFEQSFYRRKSKQGWDGRFGSEAVSRASGGEYSAEIR